MLEKCYLGKRRINLRSVNNLSSMMASLLIMRDCHITLKSVTRNDALKNNYLFNYSPISLINYSPINSIKKSLEYSRDFFVITFPSTTYKTPSATPNHFDLSTPSDFHLGNKAFYFLYLLTVQLEKLPILVQLAHDNLVHLE